MKAMSRSLEVVVIIVVIIVVIFVVLTIFTNILDTTRPTTEVKATCIQQATASCVIGNMPPMWETKFNYKEGGTVKEGSCKDLFPACKCEKNKLVGCSGD